MTKNILFLVLEKLVKLSRKSQAKLVLMGGIATSVFTQPRATYDIDGIIALTQRDLKSFLTLLKENGFKFDTKQPVKSIQGLPFITFYYPKHKTYVDLFLARNEFQYSILKRAKKIKFQNLDLCIISPEDLILVKLQTGREKDMEDIRQIILANKSKLDFVYLRKWAKLLNVRIFLKDELRSLGLAKRIIST
ncbi:MAG: nucleotidyltransferase [Candidatus Omnitrophota bacterium]|nr:nucleotidyltransferase [Candidatus Omnitrophota bacterium]